MKGQGGTVGSSSSTHDVGEVLAIIPARGGSKGIPGKNLRFVGGRPLVAHSVIEAGKCASVDRIIVSTDDPQVEAIAREHGAEVHRRTEDISGDTARSEDALLQVLEHLHQEEGYAPDLIVFLQCTSPLTTQEDIDGCVETLTQENADSSFSASLFHGFLWKLDEKGHAIGVNHDEGTRKRRQDREREYLENGAIYVMRKEGFLENRHRFFGKTVIHEMPQERSWEIDAPFELELAETLYRHNDKRRKKEMLPERPEAIVLDFDGVMTDNKVQVMENGEEGVVCSRSDGWGIGEIKEHGISPLVLSTEKNPVVTARCQKLGLEVIQGSSDKASALEKWASKRSISLERVIFVGNDVNDAECLKRVGCPVVVQDAHPDTIPLARIVLHTPGGNGAVREMMELLIENLQKRENG